MPSTRPTPPRTSPPGGATTRTWATHHRGTAASDPTGGTDCGHPATRCHRHGRVRHVRRPVHDPAQPIRLVPLHHRQRGRMRRQRGTARARSAPTASPPPPATSTRTCSRRRPHPASPSSRPICAATVTTAPVRDQQHGRARRRAHRRGRVPAGLDAPPARLTGLQERQHADRHHLRRGRCGHIESRLRRLVLP